MINCYLNAYPKI
jgi:hypothetical protein